MKTSRIISGLMCTVMALSATLCSFSAPVSAVDEFNQAKITEAMGAGWNLGNQFEAVSGRTPSETAWGNPRVTQNTLKMIKDAGFKSVRIPVSYFSKIGDGPDYTIDSSWLARIKEVVDMALAEGLYAIINMHGDGYNSMINNGAWLLCNAPESEQPAIRAKYEASWRQIAETFKSYDEHLIFFSPDEVNLRRGTKVRITGGDFEGYEGVFVKVKGARDRRVVISLQGVIAMAMATLSPDLIEVIEEPKKK